MSDDWDDVGSPSQQGELAREWNVRREQHYNVILLAGLDLSGALDKWPWARAEVSSYSCRAAIGKAWMQAKSKRYSKGSTLVTLHFVTMLRLCLLQWQAHAPLSAICRISARLHSWTRVGYVTRRNKHSPSFCRAAAWDRRIKGNVACCLMLLQRPHQAAWKAQFVM